MFFMAFYMDKACTKIDSSFTILINGDEMYHYSISSRNDNAFDKAKAFLKNDLEVDKWWRANKNKNEFFVGSLTSNNGVNKDKLEEEVVRIKDMKSEKTNNGEYVAGKISKIKTGLDKQYLFCKGIDKASKYHFQIITQSNNDKLKKPEQLIKLINSNAFGNLLATNELQKHYKVLSRLIYELQQIISGARELGGDKDLWDADRSRFTKAKRFGGKLREGGRAIKDAAGEARWRRWVKKH